MNRVWTKMSNRWVNPSLRPRPPEKPETYSGDSRPIWGLRKQHHQTKPTRERILQNMHSMIQRRRISKGDFIWSNTLTKLAWECLWPSRKTWPPSVTSSRSMNRTWCVKQSSSSLRTSNETQTSTHDTCSSEVTLGHPSDMTWSEDLSDSMLRGLFRGYRMIWIKGQGNMLGWSFVSAM